MLDGGFIQNFAARAESAFPRDHFLTELTGLVGLGQEDCGAAAVAGNE
jgi:hypothetical protein